MKILITGATGSIGSHALQQCLLHPKITSVVALSRRALPPSDGISENPKLKVILLEDFGVWPSEVLEEIKDADGMIWALGTSDNNRAANLDYPVAFQDAFVALLRKQQQQQQQQVSNRQKAPFRYIHLSGKLVEQDQEKALWFLPIPRKTKGLAEIHSLRSAQQNAGLWQSWVVKPGGVFPGSDGIVAGALTAMTGAGWFIYGDELGAFMADLVVRGKDAEEESIIYNPRLVERGRELLRARE